MIAGELECVEAVKLLDEMCDRFEAGWVSGRPLIEEFLDQAPTADRSLWLLALLEIELEVLRSRGETVRLEDYRLRFPDEEAVLKTGFNAESGLFKLTPDRPAEPTFGNGMIVTQTIDVRRMLPSGQQIGRYLILTELGEGGMGRVYLGYDPQLQRQIALKIPRPEHMATAVGRARFLREARAAAALHHRHLCPVHDVGEADGLHYIAMAYLSGESLSDWIERSLSDRQVAAVVLKIAEGLAHAHRHGILHRDLKPANVIFDQDHEPVVTDFGLARSCTAPDETATTSGAVVGSPAYMSPEQAAGDHAEIRPASDVYSLGVILYQLLTGRLPFSGKPTVVLAKILTENAPKPSMVRPGVNRGLEAICMNAMSRRIEDRYASMTELADALRDWQANGDRADTIRIPDSKSAVGGHRFGFEQYRITGIAAAFIGVAIIVSLILYGKSENGTVENSSADAEPARHLAAESGNFVQPIAAFSDPAFQIWMETVASFAPAQKVEAIEQKLRELNPRFDGKIIPTIEKGTVTRLQFDSEEIRDISPLRIARELKSLDCSGNFRASGGLSDLSPLQGMPLEHLSAIFTRISDLAPLQGMKLQTLDLACSNVADLSPLREMRLISFCCGVTKVHDVSPLKNMPLTYLEFGDTDVSDLSALRGMPLFHLACHNTKVSDLSPLKGMELRLLYCYGTEVADLSPLAGMPLVELRCNGTKVTDLSMIREMPLRKLWCDFNPIRDTELIRSIKTLEIINGEPVVDFWQRIDRNN